MSDIDILRIKLLEEKSYYGLWKIRLQTGCSAKCFDSALEKLKEGTIVDNGHKNSASSIIGAALSESALRVVRAHIGDPVTMMEKLNSRFDSRSTAAKIPNIAELVSTRYNIVKNDIKEHIDRMYGCIIGTA